MLYAHSARIEQNIPPQEYSAHILGVYNKAVKGVNEMACYAKADGELIQRVVCLASEYHDLGKLDPENQAVLSGLKKAKKLPIQHTDAGTAFLLNRDCSVSAALVRSHHIGLPDFIAEENRGSLLFRDDQVCNHVDNTIDKLIERHQHADLVRNFDFNDQNIQGNSSLFFRLALSCLADGDHTDTAIHYNDYPPNETKIELRAEERLTALNQYVGCLSSSDERSQLRSEVYLCCRDKEIESNYACCDSPVGTGKTTAIMAHLLHQADKRKLRRIFVVLPFTNIITQSVEVYRNALVLQGENPDEVVAELHHRADFNDVNSRKLTALWKAPIIVTTAVSFFETLASNSTGSLRRLHNLPGSAIFLDESHAALPAKLLPLAWQWMKDYANEWGNYWLLASGSLNRFWQIEEFDKEKIDVPEIIPQELQKKLSVFENSRIQYKSNLDVLTKEELVEWIYQLPGPRLLIVNTVQSAAAIAQQYSLKYGTYKVLHISTSLCPYDRKIAIDKVKIRLSNPMDSDWILVATSCVEAGVNFSFRTGVREVSSLVSLIQTSGRINRDGYFQSAEVWSVKLKEDGIIKSHPGLKDPIKVLEEIIKSNVAISPTLCTDALKREIRYGASFSKDLEWADNNLRFPEVEKKFKVIASDTRTVVVNQSLIESLKNRELVNWKQVQDYSVQIWGYKLESLKIPEFQNYPGLYYWTHEYNPFLGYMAGILKFENLLKEEFGII
jgi:CRISPR-associated endonuclease/helicase Cas3